ncbi:MAG TPA: sigma-70 family RNA polymerase sigma factor, partial [Opitutales bacterium]|nr:sigma-70 family RNA polymerase sigma factor [Opitutales bacterium]
MDWMSRSSRRKLKAVSAVSTALEQRLGRPASDVELQKELGLGQKAFQRMRAQTASYEFVCLDATVKDVTGSCWHETVADERQVDSAEEIETRELLEAMGGLIQSLPYRLKKVIELYYFEGLRQHAIASRLGLSEARICQLRTEALLLLRSAIEGN